MRKILAAAMIAGAAASVPVGHAMAAPTARVEVASAPGTAGLTPALSAAYTGAWQEARRQGVSMSITSGKRSWAQQQAMWRDGIAQYGSAAAARRWVLPPAESTHVSGRAVDVGPRAGAAWLETNGRRWGLCRTFDNEWWHFEVATVPGLPCPPRLPDASSR